MTYLHFIWSLQVKDNYTGMCVDCPLPSPPQVLSRNYPLLTLSPAHVPQCMSPIKCFELIIKQRDHGPYCDCSEPGPFNTTRFYRINLRSYTGGIGTWPHTSRKCSFTLQKTGSVTFQIDDPSSVSLASRPALAVP